MDQASLLISMSRTNDAVKALEAAIRIGGTEAFSYVNQNPAFGSIRDEAMRRARNIVGLPMPEARGQPQLW